MDSNVNNVQQSFLDAMNIIASRRVKEANYDKTIVGTINSWIKDVNSKAVYKINYNGGFFNASVLNNQDSYLKNTPVYIFVPQGDFSQEKIILGKVSNINTDINVATTAASLNNFSIVGKNNLNWVSEDNNNAALKSYLKNNFNWIYKIADNNNFIDIDMKSLKQYLTEGTAIMIKADFRTALSLEQKQQASAEYGLIFNLVFDNEYLKWGNTQGEILQTIIDKDIVKKKINDEEYNLKNYINGIDDIDGIDNIINKIDDNNIDTFITNPDSSLRAKVFELEAFYEAFIKNLTIEEQDNEINVIKNIIESYLAEVNLYFNITTAEDIKMEYQNWKEKSIEQNNKIIPLSLDSNQMIGSPLYFKDWTTQYAVFEIEDLQDFNHIDSILFFKRGFETSLDEEKLKDDIFVKNICFYVLKPLESVSGDYFLKVECSEQGSILQETGIKETTFKARFFRKTEDITGNTNISYYWFKEDPSITIGQEFYHPYGGQGWKLINKLTKNSLFTTTYLDNPTLKNNYKCVAVLENSDSTVLITAPFIVYNSDKGYAIELQSDTGLVFQSDIGTPIITCTVNGEEKTTLDDDKILLKYYWSFITQDNKTFSLQDIQLEEGQELDFSKLTPLNFDYYQSQDQYLKNIKLYTLNEKETKDIHLATRLQYPISNLSLNEIFTIKCDVTKVENEIEVLIGSEEINLEKRGGIAIEGYHIEFENDGQVFQYDEYGNSPKLNGKLDSLEILPIRAKLVAPNGVELAGTNIQVDWIFNLNNSMIIPLDDVTVTNGVLKDKIICNFDIKDLYDPDAINNQILCHIHFNEKDYYKQTNLLFRKIGENGTNGTDVIVQIRPVSSDPILDTQPLILYTFDNEEKGFFNNNYYTNTDIITNSQISIAKSYNKNLINTNEEEKDNDLLKSYIYQKNELLTLDKIDSITWTLAGNASESIISKGKHFKIANNTLYWDPSTNKTSYQLQIIKAHIKKDNQDYYSYYPLPIVNYHIDKSNIKSYAKERLAIDKNSYLKEIMYNADGRNPIYNHNQGLKIVNLPENSKLIITAKGGWNKEEDDPDFLLLWQELDESSGQIIQKSVKEIIVKDSNNFDMIYLLPNDTCGGSKTNNRIEVKIQTKGTNNEYIDYATLYVPIIFTLNTFGLASLNAWDGNTITIDEEGGYVMAPQIGAGEKDPYNRFTGIVMGKTEIPTGGVKNEKQIGLLGYSHGLQSIFLDAKTGNATFGLPDNYILKEDTDGVLIPNKSNNNDDYAEGRIELCPGGTSTIGGWKIGRKSLYYTEKGTLGEKNGPDYVWKDGTIQLDEDNAYAKYHDKDIAHDQGGILLYGGSKPYISIKSKPLEEGFSKDTDSLLEEGDSLELQLDPNTPTLFTIFRHNGKNKYYNNNSADVQYPVDSRTFLAGINNRGEFIANSVTNKSNASVIISEEDETKIEYVKDIASKFYFNILNAFDDQKDRPNYVGFKMTANQKTLGQFFVPLKIFTSSGKKEEALNISGGQVEDRNTKESWWGEYYRPINLYGRNINLFAPPFEPTGSNNLRAQKWSYNNLIIDRDYGQIQVGDTSLLKLYSETNNGEEDSSQLTSVRDLRVSAGKIIDHSYTEEYLNGIPLWTLGDDSYKKFVIEENGEKKDIYINVLDNGLNGSTYLKTDTDYISSYVQYYQTKDGSSWVFTKNFENFYYKYNKNDSSIFVSKLDVLSNLFEKNQNNDFSLIKETGENLDNYKSNWYFWEKNKLDRDSLSSKPYYFVLKDDIDNKAPFIKVKIENTDEEKKYYKDIDNTYLEIIDENENKNYINDNNYNNIFYKNKIDENNEIFYQNSYIITENNIATEETQPKKYYKYSIENEDYFINLSDIENKHYSQSKILDIEIKDGWIFSETIKTKMEEILEKNLDSYPTSGSDISDWSDNMFNSFKDLCIKSSENGGWDMCEDESKISFHYVYPEINSNEHGENHENCYVQAKSQFSLLDNYNYILYSEIEKENINKEDFYYGLNYYITIEEDIIKEENCYIKIDNNEKNNEEKDNEYILNNSQWWLLNKNNIYYQYKYEDSENNLYLYFAKNEVQSQNLFYDINDSNINLQEIAEADIDKDNEYRDVDNNSYYRTMKERWEEGINLFSIDSTFSKNNNNNKIIEYCETTDSEFVEKDNINTDLIYAQDLNDVQDSKMLITEDNCYKKIIYNEKDYYISLKDVKASVDVYKTTNNSEWINVNAITQETITEQVPDKKYSLLAKEYSAQIITSTNNLTNNKLKGLILSIEEKKGIDLQIKNLPLQTSFSGEIASFSLITGLTNITEGKIGLTNGVKSSLGKYTSSLNTSINQSLLGIFKINENGLFITKDLTILKSTNILELQGENRISITAKTTGQNKIYRDELSPQIIIQAGEGNKRGSNSYAKLQLHSGVNHFSLSREYKRAPVFRVDTWGGQFGIDGIYENNQYSEELVSYYPVKIESNPLLLQRISRLQFSEPYTTKSYTDISFSNLGDILNNIYSKIKALDQKIANLPSVESIATQSWVTSHVTRQGYITKNTADTLYAPKDNYAKANHQHPIYVSGVLLGNNKVLGASRVGSYTIYTDNPSKSSSFNK